MADDAAKKKLNLEKATNFMRQYRDPTSRELKKLSANQFMEVWSHYDKDGNGYIEGTELDGFLREFVSSANATDISPEDAFLGPLQSAVGCVLSSWIEKDMCLRPPDPYDKVKTLESSSSSWEGHKGVRTLRTGILTYSDAREVEAKLADGISTDSETQDNTRCTRRMWPPPERSLLESDSNDESSQAAVMQMKSTDNRVVEHHVGEWFRQNMSRMKKAGLVVTSPQTPHLQLDTEAAFSPHGPGASDNDMGLHYLQL